MRDVPQSMTDAWLSPNKTGKRRPVVRATIQRTRVNTYAYDTFDWQGGTPDRAEDRHSTGYYTSVLFGNPNPVREIRSISSCSWERTLDADAASCTLEILNAESTPIGSSEHETADFEQPGFYTFSRGRSDYAQNRWDLKENGWKNIFMPDMLVKTYEGYGADYSVDPDRDPNLVQTGVWMVDSVTYTSDGGLTLNMRDLGRLLLDHISFPPIVPKAEYPVEWEPFDFKMVPGRDSAGGKWKVPSGRTSSSNQFYAGRNIMNGKRRLTDRRGVVNGNGSNRAIDKDPLSTYWEAASEADQSGMAWWQIDLTDKTTAMNAIRIRTLGTGYVYISLLGKNGWIGRKRIPYKKGEHGVDLKAGIPYVARRRAEGARGFDTVLPRKYGDIRAIRITVHTTAWDGTYRPFPWRGGLRHMMIYTAPSAGDLSFRPGQVMKTVGNYRDYSAIPQWVCAWAGFYHPEEKTGQHYYLTGRDSTTKKWLDFRVPGQTSALGRVTALARGRIWGFTALTYTKGETTLTADMFDKKPLMDMINYVRDLTGFIFMIDETGHVVWRMPNIWSLGNVRSIVSGSGTRSDPIRQRYVVDRNTSNFVTIDENQTLISYSTTLDSKNIRERIFVGNVEGKVATTVKGYNPNPTGLRRVAGWTDQRFANKKETTVMADMIAARAMFDYKRGRVQMPGYPRVQLDDQVRIIERVTGETNWHYVMGIKSTLDMDEGTWTYDVETHWLGEDPDGAWVINKGSLAKETRQMLHAQGIR